MKKLFALLMACVMLLGCTVSLAAEDIILIAPNPNATPFTAEGAEKVEKTADGYTYTDWTGAQVTKDLYTVYVADSYVNEVTFSAFAAGNVLVYNYDEEGTYLSGVYEDDVLLTGVESATALLDSNFDGNYDYLFVQTPYNENWESEHLYVVTFSWEAPFDLPDSENIPMVKEVGGYVYTDWTGAEVVKDLYTVYLPAGTEEVQLIDFEAGNVLCYNYDATGTYVAGVYADDVLLEGVETVDTLVDANGDNEFDYLFIQTPYNENWESEHLFVVTFVYEGGYNDLTEDLWYYDSAIAMQAVLGLFDGCLTFNGDDAMKTADMIDAMEFLLGQDLDFTAETENATRGAAAGLFAIVAKAMEVEAEAGENFADCLDSANAADIAFLKAAGLVNGYPDGTFKPGNTLTRAEFCQMVYNLIVLLYHQ